VRGFGLHPEVYADLDEIRGSIAEHSLEGAERVIQEIRERIRLLVQFPHQGYRSESDLPSATLRVGA
jgi:plasmid stabilization system protein ParE